MLNLDPKRYDLAIKQLMKAMESSDKIMNNQINVVNTVRQELGDFKSVYADEVTGILGQFEILRSDVADVNVLVANCANIDFSNIGKAAMEHLYAESGLIRDVVVGDQTITGELVGVTISGDLIKGNTILAEKLVIKGEDGLYHRLNTDGAILETEQTDDNSLNGSVIMAQSIAVSKIDVKDLSAFEATIGGFKITKDAIYSGVKESVDNATRGTYLDKEGQLAVGDSNNYVKYHKGTDGRYKLDISAESLTFKTSYAKDRNYILVSKDTRSITNASGNYAGWYWSISEPIDSGETITVGFDYVVDSGLSAVTVGIVTKGSNDWAMTNRSVSTPGTTGRAKLTYTLTTAITTQSLLIYSGISGSTAGHSVTISNVKLEKGSTATAWTPAPEDAFTCATNYLNYDTSGLVVGDLSTGTLGRNVLVGSDGVYIRNGTTALAYFKDSVISLGANKTGSTVYLCGETGSVSNDGAILKLNSTNNIWLNAYGDATLQATRGELYITANDSKMGNIIMTAGGNISINGNALTVSSPLTVTGTSTLAALYATSASVNSISFRTNSARIYAPVNGTSYNMFDITGSSMWFNYGGWAGNTCSSNYGGSTIFLESKNQIYFDYAMGSTTDRIVMDHAYSAGCLRPNVDSRSTCGYAGYKWYRVYNYTSACTTSDARDKYDVTPISELGAPKTYAARRAKSTAEPNDNVLERLYSGLVPKVFRKKKEVKDQIHIGFVAQDIGTALEEMGLDEEHFGFLIHDSWSVEERDENGEIMTDENGNPVMNEGEEYGLAYEEFIALNTHMIQKQQKTIDELTRRVTELEKGA